MQYILMTEQAFMSVVILCAVVSVMLFGFWGYHINLIRHGVTTNERAKMSRLRYLLKRACNFYEKWIEMKESGNKDFEPAQKSCEFYGVKKDWSLEKIKEELAKAKVDLASVQESPYKTGFIQALMMVYFPHSYSGFIGDAQKKAKTQ